MNLKELRQKRLKWVEANRENGFEDGIKSLLTDLYPDNAHFIYELLQNAEDAQATEVCFILKEDSVEFEHNGDRLFSFADVESITSIGDSTKREDPTNIGKFGIGFKAVFAYTSTPEIASGKFHFRIRDLVVPDTDGLAPFGKKETRFIFPFDNPQKPPQKARAEIEKNLRQLDASTLLFLSNIQKIEYLLPDGTLGFLERKKRDESRIEILVQHPEDAKSDSVFFLRFEKEVSVNDENDQPKPCRIAVAFGLEKTQARNLALSDGWKIKRLNRGQVCIYFPAEKETSNLRFHLHAPFASTVARDSVRDCPANDELRDHLAVLIAESMTTIREQGLLTVGFLAVLPNERDNLSSFYTPIMKKLIRAFQQENLTPMKQGGHKAANDIFRGSARMSDLISDNDLATLLGGYYSPPLWISNPPQRNQREDNFLSMLDIEEVTPEMFAQKLSKQFLVSQDDEWFIKFYEFLSDQKALWRPPLWLYGEPPGILQNKPILRLQDGRHVNPFRYDGSPNAYLAAGTDTETSLPIVKVTLSSHSKAREFLELLGIKEVDRVVEVIEEILPKYTGDSVAVAPKENKRDLMKIERAYQTTSHERQSQLVQQLEETPFILAECAGTGKTGYRKPEQVYLESDELRVYFFENDSIGFLSSEYPDDVIPFLKELGVSDKIRIKCRSELGSTEDITLASCRDSRHRRGLKGFDSDINVDGLENALENPSTKRSEIIWNKIAVHYSHCIKGEILISSRQDFSPLHASTYYKKIEESKFGKLLIETAWLPDSNGEMHKPCDLYLDDLPESFDRDERLAVQLDMKKKLEEKLVEEAVKSFGFDSGEEAKEVAELKRKDPEGYKKWRESYKQRVAFPERTTQAPERRQKRISEQYADALQKEYELRERSDRTSRGAIDPTQQLREQYTNEDDQMICQICKEEMPFKKRDGEYYFEAVEALSKDYLPKEHEAQFLALCPVCAARYKEFVKNDEDAMRKLHRALKKSDGLEVSLTLGEWETSIRFVGTHRLDMKTILQQER